MMPSRPNLLSTTRLVLRALLSLNLIFGMGIGALLLASFIAPPGCKPLLGRCSPYKFSTLPSARFAQAYP